MQKMAPNLAYKLVTFQILHSVVTDKASHVFHCNPLLWILLANFVVIQVSLLTDHSARSGPKPIRVLANYICRQKHMWEQEFPCYFHLRKSFNALMDWTDCKYSL